MRVVPFVLGSFFFVCQIVLGQIAERKDYTQDVSKAIQTIPMRFTQASSPDAHIWYLENGTNKNLIGATTVLYYYTSATRAWRVTVTGSVVSASAGHIKIPFLPSQLNTNSLNGTFDYLCKVSDGANQVLAVTKGELVLEEDISATAGVGSLPAVTNVLNWGLYSNYQSTATAGPYRTGTNITFRALADGAVYIDAVESTQFVAVMDISISDLSNRVISATNQTAINSNILNNAINIITTNSVPPSGTNTLQAQINTNTSNIAILTTNSVPPSGTNSLQNSINILTTNSVPPSSTNSLQWQIATNTTDITNHETRITSLEDNVEASTNTFDSLLVGRTNGLAQELTTNGSFTADSGWWTATTCYWSTARIYINAGVTGTLTPSNALAITNGLMYLVQYNKGTTNGTVTVSMGGFTNTETSAGVHAVRYPVFDSTAGFVMTLTGGGSGNYIDDISVKRVTNGSATVAENLGVGHNLWVDGTGIVRRLWSEYYYDSAGQLMLSKTASDVLTVADAFELYVRDLYATNSFTYRGTNIETWIVNVTNNSLSTGDVRVARLPNLEQLSNVWVDTDGDMGVGLTTPLHRIDTTGAIHAVTGLFNVASMGRVRVGETSVLDRVGAFIRPTFTYAANPTNIYGQLIEPIVDTDALNTFGLDVQGTVNSGKTVTNYFAARLKNPVNSGTINHLRLLYIETPTAGDTSNYAIYVVGGLGYFGGVMEIFRLTNSTLDGSCVFPGYVATNNGSGYVLGGQITSAGTSGTASNALDFRAWTNAVAVIRGSDGKIKASTNDWYAAYVSNAVSGDIVELLPATYTYADANTITTRQDVTLCSAVPGRKVILDRTSGAGLAWNLPLTNFARFADIEFRYTQLFGVGGWGLNGGTAEFHRCVFVASGIPGYATIVAAANTTNNVIAYDSILGGSASVGGGGKLHGEFYGQCYVASKVSWSSITNYDHRSSLADFGITDGATSTNLYGTNTALSARITTANTTATNAQYYGTNFPLSLAAADTVAYTNRGTNTYLMGLLSRPVELQSYSGSASASTVTLDIVTFLRTNDLLTATPTLVYTGIVLTASGASGTFGVIGSTNRLWCAYITNVVGTANQWDINIDGVQH